METIQQPQLLKRYLEHYNIPGRFTDPDLPYELVQYAKGEQICAPNRPMDRLLILVKGSIRLYDYEEDFSAFSIGRLEPPAMLGEVEFCGECDPFFYAEAESTALCVSLSLKKCREQLACDVRFLNAAVSELVQKLKMSAATDNSGKSLEERTLLYMQNYCDFGCLSGVNTAVARLRCSRRQLQRVLKKMCEDGVAEKCGKGFYRLTGK